MTGGRPVPEHMTLACFGGGLTHADCVAFALAETDPAVSRHWARLAGIQAARELIAVADCPFAEATRPELAEAWRGLHRVSTDAVRIHEARRCRRPEPLARPARLPYVDS